MDDLTKRDLQNLPPIEVSPDIREQKLVLGENIKSLVDTLDKNGFDSESSTYTFSIEDDPTVKLWLPADIDAFVAQQDSPIRAVDIVYDTDLAHPRPRVAITIYLKNAERVVIIKDFTSMPGSDFSVEYSTNQDAKSYASSRDAGYLISSLLLPLDRQPDINEAASLAEHGTKHVIDPTSDDIADVNKQLLPRRATSWQKEETYTTTVEDDRNTLLVVKETNSNESNISTLTFTQSGSEISDKDLFEATASLSLAPAESTFPASLEYLRVYGDEDEQRGYGEDSPHFMDFISSVAKAVQKEISEKVENDESFENHSEVTIGKDRLRRNAPEERE